MCAAHLLRLRWELGGKGQRQGAIHLLPARLRLPRTRAPAAPARTERLPGGSLGQGKARAQTHEQLASVTLAAGHSCKDPGGPYPYPPTRASLSSFEDVQAAFHRE